MSLLLKREILQKIADKHNLPVRDVEAIYKEYWKKIKSILEAYDINSSTSYDDTPVITLPYLGKIYAKKSVYNSITNKRRRDENKED